MKILFIQTNYPDFLDSFYKKLNLQKENYKSLKRKWAEEYFGSSNFYLKSLKGFGWTGEEIIANSNVIQNAWAKEHGIKRIKVLPIMNLLPARVKNILGLNKNEKDLVIKQVKYYRPNVVYIHDVTYFTQAELYKIKKNTKLVVGQIAYPKPLNLNILKSYDLLISSLPNFVSDFREMRIKTEYLKWCFEESILNSIKNNKRVYDVTYIGGFSPLHSKGNKVIDEVAKKVDVNIWGYGRPNLKNAWGREMYEIFSKSKIVLNRHINISKHFANNMRMYEATGMGALLITDQKVNIDEFFKVGKEIVTYKTSKDLATKIKYYLKNSAERNRIAKAGQKRTLKDHTYAIRMKELDIILKHHLKNGKGMLT